MTQAVRAFLDAHSGVPKCRMVELYQELEEECLAAGNYSEAARYARKKKDYMALAHMWQQERGPSQDQDTLKQAAEEADKAFSSYRQQEKCKADRNYDQRLVWTFVASVVFLILWGLCR